MKKILLGILMSLMFNFNYSQVVDQPLVEQSLPVNWVKKTDSKGKVYYYNKKTKEKTFDRPKKVVVKDKKVADQPLVEQSLPVNWVKKTDSKGKVYYYNKKTKEKTFDRPKKVVVKDKKVADQHLVEQSLPVNWVKKTDSKGKVYYYNKKTKEKTFDKPKKVVVKDKNSLPVYWVKMTDSKGKVYYYNKKTKKKTFDRPKLIKLSSGEVVNDSISEIIIQRTLSARSLKLADDNYNGSRYEYDIGNLALRSIFQKAASYDPNANGLVVDKQVILICISSDKHLDLFWKYKVVDGVLLQNFISEDLQNLLRQENGLEITAKDILDKGFVISLCQEDPETIAHQLCDPDTYLLGGVSEQLLDADAEFKFMYESNVNATGTYYKD